MNRSKRKYVRPALITVVVLFVALQFIRPKIDNPPAKGEFKAPAEVKSIIERACYDCHSNVTNLRWYDQISPIYWKVAEHVKTGREKLNFSNWDSLAAPDQKGLLWTAVNQIAAGAMPIKDYEFVHPSAKVSANDLTVLKNYLMGMVHDKPSDTTKINALDKQRNELLNPITKIPQAANGVTYIPDYKNWQPISTTERFDNGTMRVIFGNDVAVKAIRENNIHPWPNGTVFAKVAWDQIEDKDGNTTTGAFKQIEYMIKDDKKYASTKGWGWARFKTAKLTPYGKDAMFTTECVDCHKPLKDEDYVFTMPIKN